MKYYIIAGEASGDLHASNLMQGIKKCDQSADFRYFGGDLMKAQGGVLVKHYRDMAFMGFIEVLQNLGTISKNFKSCKSDILSYKPDVVILVDYPGFNLRMAKFAKRSGFKVFYYIAPKVWAWRESRVKVLKKYVDQLFVIFPFEIDYFKKHGIDVIYEGNPLTDSIAGGLKIKSFGDFIEVNKLMDKPIIALVAGSRKQEIKYNLPQMLKLVVEFPEYQFVIAGAPSLKPEVYNKHIKKGLPVSLVFNQTYQLIKNSTLALVTSGTATLETAMLKTPEVVCYRGGFFSMLIAWMVIKVKYISLVNLIMGREVVKELKQYDLNTKNLIQETRKLLPGEPKREEMLADFTLLNDMLGKKGTSARVGAKIVSLLNQQKQPNQQ